MKKLLLSTILTILCSSVQAGLITHNDYTAGDTITSAKQNTNENTIVNEINGNLDSANFEDGGIATADIADNAVTNAKLATVVQSSMTNFASYASYKRPVLTYVSATTADIENNTSTSNETCVIFPDSNRRCVTENTGSTTKYRRWDITATCTYATGTEDSGVAGAVEATNTWYALYAVKSQVSASNFVICSSTRTPTQANASSLDTMFQANGWSYLGLIRNGGDGTASTGDILEFKQTGNMTYFLGANNGGSVGLVAAGIRLADTAGAATLTYTYAAGTGNTDIPSNVTFTMFNTEHAAVAGTAIVRNAADTRGYFVNHINGVNGQRLHWSPATEGVKLSNGPGSSIAYDIILSGWIDGALGVGINPLF